MNKPFTGILILILAMTTLQYGSSLAKNLFSLSGIAGATGLRLFFASFCLMIFLRPWRRPFKKEYLLPLFLYGSTLGLMNLSFYFALSRIPLGIAVALEFIGPLGLALISSKCRWDFLWVLCAGLGIYFLLPLKEDHESLDYWGIIYALLAGLFWALYIIFGKRLSNTLPTKMGISYGMCIAALVVMPFAITLNFNELFNPAVLLPGLLVGIFASAIPYALELRAMRNLSQKSFSILMSLEPAVASLIGVVFLREYLTLDQSVDIGLVCVASVGTSLSSSNSL